ncbi:calcium-activated chloride channel regulator 1 [Trichonephila clavipes]|uniref:Calcium-activated chloride channel regulator 1 n=1 Tax=Trichonephila clavipes TaxID=2585209 RepID=A0A8X7BB57_TRICX|nr:calcium-activated chloride channel regulator 1 [Trichonephila clavipes]
MRGYLWAFGLQNSSAVSPAASFCEGRLSLGPNHNPNSPSKHNLLCNEEGTWFTVLRSPDFKHGKCAHVENSGIGERIAELLIGS